MKEMKFINCVMNEKTIEEVQTVIHLIDFNIDHLYG